MGNFETDEAVGRVQHVNEVWEGKHLVLRVE